MVPLTEWPIFRIHIVQNKTGINHVPSLGKRHGLMVNIEAWRFKGRRIESRRFQFSFSIKISKKDRETMMEHGHSRWMDEWS